MLHPDPPLPRKEPSPGGPDEEYSHKLFFRFLIGLILRYDVQRTNQRYAGSRQGSNLPAEFRKIFRLNLMNPLDFLRPFRTDEIFIFLPKLQMEIIFIHGLHLAGYFFSLFCFGFIDIFGHSVFPLLLCWLAD